MACSSTASAARRPFATWRSWHGRRGVSGTASIVRPDTNLHWLLTRYLDRGVDGIIVPFVHTAQEAQHIVDTVRYARPTDHEEKNGDRDYRVARGAEKSA